MNFSSSKYPISDIVEWRDTNKLEIRPDFQRKAVWSLIAKEMLLDTIIKHIPMPKIYLQTKMKGVIQYRIVIDGQQRLTAILDYVDGKFALPESCGEEWAKKTYEELSDEQKKVILNYEIDVNSLKDPSDEDVRNLYSRVNKYTVQLNSQELRRADYPGDFINLAEDLASLEFFGDARMFTANMTRRMLDVEFIEELLCIVIEGMQNKKETLDQFCERYQEMKNKDVIRNKFMGVIDDIAKIFTDNEMIIRKTRFKQRSDFYSLFSAITSLKNENKTLQDNKLEELRSELKYLNDNIGPHSDDKELSDYAINCTSDANSLSSRESRKDFLIKYIEKAYK